MLAPTNPGLTGSARGTFGHFPSGVTVITGSVGGSPVGLSVSSFCSLSLDPARVLFCPSNSSTTWPRIARTGHFCANVLSAEQGDLCRRFATPGADRFSGVDWRTGTTGAPILSGALAWIECAISSVIEAGDHAIVIGDVTRHWHAENQSPLVYFRGGYLDVAARTDPNGQPTPASSAGTKGSWSPR